MLTRLAASWFAPQIRARGHVYMAEGRVRKLVVTPMSITARVRGTELYTVQIILKRKPTRWTLTVDCTCEFAAGTDPCCKHVWAVLSAAELHGAGDLGPPPASVRIVSLLEGETREDDDDADTDGPASDARTPALRRAPNGFTGDSGPRRSTKPRQPMWLPLLSHSAAAHGPARRDEGPIGPVLYVIETQRSRERGILTIALLQTPLPEAKATPSRKLTIVPPDVARMSDPADRAICGMLVGAARPGREWTPAWEASAHGFEQGSSLWQVNASMAPVLLPMIQATGRLLRRDEQEGEPEPVRWDEGAAWDLVLWIARPTDGLGSEGNAQDFVLAGGLRRACGRAEQEMLRLDEPAVVVDGDPGLVLHRGVLSPLRTFGSFALVSGLRFQKPARVLPEELPRLLSELEARRHSVPVVWPAEWNVRAAADLPLRGRVVLRTENEGEGLSVASEATTVQVEFEYGEHVVNGSRESAYGSVQPDPAAGGEGAPVKTIVRRRPAEERALLGRLSDLGVRTEITYRGEPRRSIAPRRIPALVAALLEENWTVLGDRARYRRAGQVSVNVSSGIDWFELRGDVAFEGGAAASVADLLAALKRKESFVRLGDGSLGMLPEAWLARHERWLRLGRTESESGAVRFSKAQVGVIDALLAEMPEASCDAQVAAARKRLAKFRGVHSRREPATFKGELRGYQREGLGWLRFLAEFGFGGILADDMGLGKTVQLLAHVADERKRGDSGPWLIVAPRSLIFNWAREAARFTPGLKVLEYTGAARNGAGVDLGAADLVLTTYGTMRLDVERIRKTEFACVVLDEAQAIKNAQSQAAKAARLLRARRRLALTGTPVENRLEDLWSIMEFLNPGMLGDRAAFRGAFVRGGVGGGGRGEEEGDAGGDADMAILRRAVRPFILRRTKSRVATELPERSEQTVVCELSASQRALYENLLRHYRDALLGKKGVVERRGLSKSRIQVLEALLRLRQAACHPAMLEWKPPAGARDGKSRKPAAALPKARTAPARPAESAKVKTLLEMLREIIAEGHRALVFSQFAVLLGLVRDELEAEGFAYEHLDGSTPARERSAAVDRFQREKSASVFLISLKAGGVGLNLTAADYVFLLDPWWNPAAEAQAIDRTHRIGQDKKVIAYRLIARGTVEERIQELQASKRELAAAIAADDAMAAGSLAALTREELDWLLS